VRGGGGHNAARCRHSLCACVGPPPLPTPPFTRSLYPLQGVLKLRGTILPTANKFITLQCNPKAAAAGGGGGGGGGSGAAAASMGRAAAVTCEDVFDKVVAFSEAVWLGKPEDNPAEAARQPPAFMGGGKTSAPYTFQHGAGRPPRAGAGTGASPAPAARGKAGAPSASQASAGDAEAEGAAALGVAAGRSRRAAAAVVKRYKDTGSSGE
jgi:hypothetical protein